MKNTFKKTAGIVLATSIMCAILATGCSNTTDTEKNTATEATTESTKENTNKNKKEAEKENATEMLEYIELLDEPAVIKESSLLAATNTGITVEGRNSKYAYIDVFKPGSSEFEYEIKDDSIKEIFLVSMNYLPDGTIEYLRPASASVYLAETVKVSIPYEEGMCVVHSVDGVAYDINAEYIDGKYVFETNTLGTFIMRTEPVGRATPEKTKNLELKQQTIVDEITGIEVSGMLPVGAEIESTVDFIDMVMMSDRWDPPYTVDSDYPEFSNVEDYYIEYEYEKKIDNIAKIINRKNWAEEEPTLGGKLNVSIAFVKDYEILDFESDLTVTLPFNYRRGMVTGGLTGEPVIVQYDYDTKEFVDITAVSAENTPKGMFQFKTKTPGRFFISTKDGIDSIKGFYTYEE